MANRENVGKRATWIHHEYDPQWGEYRATDVTYSGEVLAWQDLPFLTYVIKADGVRLPFQVKPEHIERFL